MDFSGMRQKYLENSKICQSSPGEPATSAVEPAQNPVDCEWGDHRWEELKETFSRLFLVFATFYFQNQISQN